MSSIKILILSILAFSVSPCPAQVEELFIGPGWAGNSVNTVVFRKNSVVSHENGTQFAAYYDPQGSLILASRRTADGQWTLKKNPYRGHVGDAHNSISIMVDSEGYLHVSWDHHGHPLRYARSLEPFSLELGEKESMTGVDESNVTYPEFYRMGDHLIFIYRDGASGSGNLVMNRYDTATRAWTRLHDCLIDGQGERNAYWQAATDAAGTIHLSWVWRESPDVASNHDMCYARSMDGGVTWQRSDGTPYALPIDASTAEYAWRIPEGSELINQTSMTTDRGGNPYIATYWRDAGETVPQYRVIYLEGGKWKMSDCGLCTVPFSLSGGGTKDIPISRPQVMVAEGPDGARLLLLYRDRGRGAKVSLAECGLSSGEWSVRDLADRSVGAWEPSFDTWRWQNEGVLDIFVQRTVQVDGEGRANVEPEPVSILSVRP